MLEKCVKKKNNVKESPTYRDWLETKTKSIKGWDV
jgi:hypothetical protein